MYGGILYLLNEIEIRNIVISTIGQEESENFDEFVKLVKNKKVHLIKVKEGNRINIEDNLYFDVLWPIEKYKITENAINNNSIVCKMCYGDFSMLFTGDIEVEAEKMILDKKINVQATVLKVAHHGSKTSSTKEFLNAVKPKIALIGVEKDNKFGHPNEEVINRLIKMR